MFSSPVKKRVSQDSKKYYRRAGIGLLIAAVIIHLALAFFFDFTQDDAFITFRYAANYLNGEGLVYNSGERVEGYTNFLWLLLMIFGRLAGMDFVLFSKILGALCSVGVIIILYLTGVSIFGRNSFLPGLACLIPASAYSFAYWSMAGLETAAFSLAT